MTDDDVWLRVNGRHLTGFPTTETLQRAALDRTLGEPGAQRFFERFLDVFFADADAAFLAGLGMNSVRRPVRDRHFDDDLRPFELEGEGFRLLDRAIDRCARHRLYAIIDLHAVPGASSWRPPPRSAWPRCSWRRTTSAGTRHR
jgi:hypothetical protein